jgi:hypothetical protein
MESFSVTLEVKIQVPKIEFQDLTCGISERVGQASGYLQSPIITTKKKIQR